MTAPIAGMPADVAARIAAIQAQISSLGPGNPAARTAGTRTQAATLTPGATNSSASDFSTAMAAATSGTLSHAVAAPTSSTRFSPVVAAPTSGTLSSAVAAATPGLRWSYSVDAVSIARQTAAAGSSDTASQVIANAKDYLGDPYLFGGESHDGIDCSGLMQEAFAQAGIDLPRTAAEQQKMGTLVPSLDEAKPGDLLTFGKPAHHVAMYLGDNKMIEAPYSGQVVRVVEIHRDITEIRRVIPDGGVQSAVPPASAAGGLSAQQLTSAGLNEAVASYASQFAAAESRYQLPTGLLAAVAQQESGGNANAVSAAGAQGLMQLMPSTAAEIGANAFDPAQAIDAAGKILSGNLSEFGTVPLALAAYNAGGGAVRKYNGIPPYRETQNYVKSITAMIGRGA